MDLEVNLESSTNFSDRSSSVARKLSNTAERASRAAKVLPDSPADSQDLPLPFTGRKQGVTRRASLNSNASSSKQIAELSGEDVDKTSASQKQRRKSRPVSTEGQEVDDSSVFTKPTTSTRTRHLIARRYSPSPDTRPGAKLKNLMAKIQDKEKQGKQKLATIYEKSTKANFYIQKLHEFSFTKLPKDYDSVSIILLGNLRFEPIDFELPHDIAKRLKEAAVLARESPVVNPSPAPATISAKVRTKPSRSTARTRQELVVKEEVLSVQSSDEEDANEGSAPVIRMADIGAAPFTPTPVASPTNVTTKPRRRPKPSAPVIKLPRRRTIDVANRMDLSERSSMASASSAEDVVGMPVVEKVVSDFMVVPFIAYLQLHISHCSKRLCK
ncbi:unnamed protein product [Strongylus vulgaris]|uniref:Uncharacterized protein n=1 Tax=Strongylus vulgaris TaxID=40348 RepID=A0A3P7INS7_STRVU|nr:unnamed protein product [Strongylus vulgaris]